jgi:hypothetical protein
MSDVVIEVAVDLPLVQPVPGRKEMWEWILSADGLDAWIVRQKDVQYANYENRDLSKTGRSIRHVLRNLR